MRRALWRGRPGWKLMVRVQTFSIALTKYIVHNDNTDHPFLSVPQFLLRSKMITSHWTSLSPWSSLSLWAVTPLGSPHQLSPGLKMVILWVCHYKSLHCTIQCSLLIWSPGAQCHQVAITLITMCHRGCTEQWSVCPGEQSGGVSAEREQAAQNLQSSAWPCRTVCLHSSKLSWRGQERI